MVTTQIQLPDELFARAKKLCAAREISFAELVRRGIESTLSVYAEEPEPDWQPPTPRSLGWHGLSGDDLKIQAQGNLPRRTRRILPNSASDESGIL